MFKRRVYLRPGYTDMRKSINSLGVIVQESMKLNLFEASFFLFCNRRRDILKILYWDKNGFCLWQKRLEEEKFPWAESEEGVSEISTKKLFWLLKGIDFFKEHKGEKRYLKI